MGREPFPVVVLLHGGCWNTSFGGPTDMAPLADALRHRGIASVNVSYRRVGEPGGGWPGTMIDVGKAVDSVRTLAPRFHFDLSRVAVVGHSAGAQLALWTATRDKLTPASDLFATNPLKPRAVVAIDGPGTLAEFVGADIDVCGEPVIAPFMGGTPEQVPQRYRDASAQDHLPLGVSQYLVVGALGKYMETYIKRAQAAGDHVVVARPKRATHFDILMPWRPEGAPAVEFASQAVSGVAVRPTR